MKNINKLILAFCVAIAIFADVVIQPSLNQMCDACSSNSGCDTGFCSMPDGLTGMCYITGCACGAASCNECAECNAVGWCGTCTDNGQCKAGINGAPPQCYMPDGISGTCYITGCPCGMENCGTCYECGGTPYCGNCTADSQCQPGINNAPGQCNIVDGIGTCVITNCACGMETCGTCYACSQDNCLTCTNDSQCASNYCNMPDGLSGICYITNCECGVTGCDTCADCCKSVFLPCIGSTDGTQGNCCDGLMCAVCASQAASNGQAGYCQYSDAPALLACGSGALGIQCETTEECQSQYQCINSYCECGSPAGLNCPCTSSTTCASPLVCGEVDTCVSCGGYTATCTEGEQCCTSTPFCVAGTCSCATSNCGDATVGNGCECNANGQCCSGSCMNTGSNTDGSCEDPGVGGATCYNSGNCSEGFYCDFSSDSTMGICECAQPGGLACPCTSASECTGGTYCNSINGTQGSCEQGNALGINCAGANECDTNPLCKHISGFEINEVDHNETFNFTNISVEYYNCGHGSCTLQAYVPAKITDSSQYITAKATKETAQAEKADAQTDKDSLPSEKLTAQTNMQNTISTDKNADKVADKTTITTSAQYAADEAKITQGQTDKANLPSDKLTAQTNIQNAIPADKTADKTTITEGQTTKSAD